MSEVASITIFPNTCRRRSWDRIKAPAADQIIKYDKLPSVLDSRNLNKLAVLKVNGGLGTSMGLSGAKSA